MQLTAIDLLNFFPYCTNVCIAINTYKLKTIQLTAALLEYLDLIAYLE